MSVALGGTEAARYATRQCAPADMASLENCLVIPNTLGTTTLDATTVASLVAPSNNWVLMDDIDLWDPWTPKNCTEKFKI